MNKINLKLFDMSTDEVAQQQEEVIYITPEININEDGVKSFVLTGPLDLLADIKTGLEKLNSQRVYSRKVCEKRIEERKKEGKKAQAHQRKRKPDYLIDVDSLVFLPSKKIPK